MKATSRHNAIYWMFYTRQAVLTTTRTAKNGGIYVYYDTKAGKKQRIKIENIYDSIAISNAINKVQIAQGWQPKSGPATFGGIRDITVSKDGVATYEFSDYVKIAIYQHEVFLIQGNAKAAHFDMVKKAEKLDTLYWSGLLTENGKKEKIA